MANNINVKDAAGTTVTVQSTDNAGVQLPAHQVTDSTGANALAVAASGAAKVEGAGTAGSASCGVVTVQRVPSMTPVQASQAPLRHHPRPSLPCPRLRPSLHQ